MEVNKFKAWLLACVATVSLSLNAQTGNDSAYAARLQRAFFYESSQAQEKVYLHTDKPDYFSGDTIWLKAYLVNAITHYPASGSRFVYVELLNRKDKVLHRLKIRREDNRFLGYIPLDASMEDGDYYLRAYTQWMLNDSLHSVYSRNLKIHASHAELLQTAIRYETGDKGERTAILTLKKPDGGHYGGNYVHYMVHTKPYGNAFRQQRCDRQGEIRISIPPKQEEDQYIYIIVEDGVMKHKRTFHVPNSFDYHVDFFPEGGNLMAGTTQKIALKALDADGRSLDVAGVVTNQQGDTLTSFKSVFAGMGSFMLHTEEAETYQATVTAGDGVVKRFPLPRPQREGCALSVVEQKDRLHYAVHHAPGSSLPDSLFLVGHIRGFLLFVHRVPASGEGNISTRGIPDGVLTLTLLDGDYLPHSERLFFIRQDASRWEARLDSSYHGRRTPVDIDLCLTDENGAPLSGDFSVSVTDDYAVHTDSLADHILSSLLLSSDLKGHIESPGYYFRDRSPRTKACLDNLMLTQGWTRFKMEDLLAEKQRNARYFMEVGQYISGTLKDVLHRPMAGKTVAVFLNRQLHSMVQTDQEGRFVAGGLDFAEKGDIEVKSGTKDKFFKADIQVDEELLPEAHNIHPYIRPHYTPKQQEYIQTIQAPYVEKDGMLVVNLPEVVAYSKMLVKDRLSSYKMDDEEMIAQQNASTALDLVQTVPGFRVIDNRPYLNPNMSMRPELLMSNDVNNRNVLRPKQKPNYGPTVQFMVDNRTVSFQSLPLIPASEIVSVHKIDPDMGAGMPISQQIKQLERAYEEALENGASLEELDELEPTAQYRKIKDGTARVYGGCILLTSRTGNLTPPRVSSSSERVSRLGYTAYKEFYVPHYETEQQRNSQAADERTTLHWQPRLQPDADGHARIRFYTGDRNSKYTLTVEGVTEKGRICRLVQQFD